MTKPSRREFLCRAGAAAALGGSVGSVSHSALAAVPSAGKAMVALDPGIEPLVRLLEGTPRSEIVETFAAKVREGVGYKEMLAALLLAAVRNVEPRPSVGFKFHSVLVVQSIHLASTALPEDERWLPFFWALDYFKGTQAEDERERGWTMGPVDESAVPKAGEAAKAFAGAMERWDEAGADAAIAGLVRTAKPEAIWPLFFRYGGRDFRSIGHKVIDVANSHRVLGVIGCQHAEPVLRSLAYALLMHEDGNPAERDDPADRPWRRNQELAGRIPAGWQNGKADREATRALLRTLRGGSENDACDKVVELLNGGAGAQSIWDALFLGSAELVVRQPGIVALHAATTTNAFHYCYQAAGDDTIRRLILLQNAAFLPMFRQAMSGRGKVSEFAIDKWEPAESGNVQGIFETVRRDSMKAARMTLAYFEDGGALGPWVEKARRLVVQKGASVHDYKFAMAAIEDAERISPEWLGRHLAASTFLLQGSGEQDNPLIRKAAAFLKGST
ncbi:MAG: hypothetical protein GXX96_04470 [Planctomycetaceae bacterium]|nr:hypothetical protein [Planctomycetaceae bacterium]